MAHSALDWAEVEAPGHADVLALHTRVLSLRARFLQPLLGRIAGGAGQFRALSDRAIIARWEAGTEHWIIAANFSPDPIRFAAPSGQTVFALGPEQPDQLSGWGFRALISPAE